jgi:TP901 family phage tail tape measure protein
MPGADTLAELFVNIAAKGQDEVEKVFDALKSAGEAVVSVFETISVAAIDFETAIGGIRKTTGLSGDALKTFEMEIQRLATSMAGISLGDLLDVGKLAGQMGVAGDKLADFTRDIGKISIALDDVSASSAATGIFRILSVFGKGTEDTLRLGSALNKLADISSATGSELISMTERMSGHAAILGISAQEVVALAAAMRDAGIETQVGATAMDQVFLKMATNAEGFAKVAGVSMEQWAATMKASPIEALKLFIKGLNEFSPESAMKALESLKMTGRLTAATILQLSTAMGKLDGFMKVSNDEWSSMSSIQKEVAIQSQLVSAQLQRMGNIFQVTAGNIGASLLPVIKSAAEGIGLAATQIGAFMETMKPTIDSWAASMATGVQNVSLLFEDLPTGFQLASLEIADILAQLPDLIGANAWIQLEYGAQSTVTVLGNIFAAFGTYLVEVFSGAVDQILTLLERLRTNPADLAASVLGVGGDGGAAGAAGAAAAGKAPAGVAPKLPTLDLSHAFEGLKPPPMPVLSMPDADRHTDEIDKLWKKLEDKRDARKTAAKADEEALPPESTSAPRPKGTKEWVEEDAKEKAMRPGGWGDKSTKAQASSMDPIAWVKKMQDNIFNNDSDKEMVDILRGLAQDGIKIKNPRDIDTSGYTV